jgi:hypothetical protein
VNTRPTARISAARQFVGTGFASIVPASLLCLVTLVATAFTARPAQAGVLLVANASTDVIGKYDATTGATIQTPFITTAPGNGYYSLAVDGNNHLFVNPQIANTGHEYNATTGAVINPSFINGQDVPFRGPMALDGNNHLFMEAGGNPGSWVAEYDATTGATINVNFINLNQGLQVGGAMTVDKVNNHIFVVDYNSIREFDGTTGATINYYFAGADTPRGMVVDAFNHLFVSAGTGVMEYNSLTGAVINPTFISGNTYPQGLALDDNNHLFATYSDFNASFEAVGEYNATTGAAIKVDFINGQGLDQPASIVFVPSVPEPSSLLLVTVAVVCGAMFRRKRLATGTRAFLMVALARSRVLFMPVIPTTNI